MLLRTISYILISIALFSANTAYAQTSNSPTTPQEIAFTFAQLTKSNPDFKLIIKGTKKYNNASAIEKSHVIKEMIKDIEFEYMNYKISENFIVIHSNIKVRAELDSMLENGIYMDFSNKDASYFPYVFGKDIISVMPDDLDQFKFVHIPRNELKYIRRNLYTNNHNLMEVILKPYHANNKETVLLDNFEQYIIKAKIAEINLYGKNQELLWSHSADWYKDGLLFSKEKFRAEDILD